MITPTQDIALQRWDTLPMTLREALFSEPNSDFLWKACLDEHLPNEKIYTVSKVAGYVLLGFLHPEDVAQEIKERIGIDAKTANAIEEALNKRIFVPLRMDIDKVYSPLSKLEPLPNTSSSEIIHNINAQPKNVSISSTPITSKPTTLSDVGWSRASSTGPGIKLTTLSNAAPQPPRPIAATTPLSPAVPIAPAEPAPMMLHEDTSFKAIEKNAGFTLSKPGAGAEVRMGQHASQTPARPAVLEFGGMKPPTPPQNKPSPAPVSSSTHYTELKLSLSAVPAADSGPRNVSQIAPSIPKPPTPPQAAVPIPRPPQPPKLPQSNKPIVKNFL